MFILNGIFFRIKVPFKIYVKSKVSTSVGVQVLIHIFQYLHTRCQAR